MDREAFIKLVEDSLLSIPEEFQKVLTNVGVIVEDEPSEEQKKKLHLRRNTSLFGLYEGIPLNKRMNNYTMVLPDKITIFQKPIEAYFADAEGIKSQIRATVLHEIGHHLGLSERELRKLQ